MKQASKTVNHIIINPRSLAIVIISINPILAYWFFCLFVFLFLAVLGLCCCAWAFSSCGERGLLFIVARRLLIAVASLVVEHRL